jgi:uncharacterized membrane protein
MNIFYKYVICIICVVLMICFAVSTPQHVSGPHYGGTHADLGLSLLLSFVPVFIIGIILTIIRDTRKFGLACLASSGLLVLIGLGVCSLG